MIDNPFARAASSSPPFPAAARRERLFITLGHLSFANAKRDAVARLWWNDTATLACHLAHDAGLADVEAAIPRGSSSHVSRQAFFLTLARMAQACGELPASTDALLRHGVLPTTCRLAAPDFHRLAADLHGALDRGDAAHAGNTMQSLVTYCTFTPGADTEPDEPRALPT
jgi:hypothetical protein